MIKSKKIRLSLLDLYLGIICLFPIPTVLVDGGVINKLMFVLLFAAQIGILVSRPIKKKRVYLLLLLIGHYIYALLQTQFPMTNANLLFYYPFFIIYTFFMTDNSAIILEWFRKNRQYVHGMIILWSVLTAFSALLPGSYYQKEGNHYYFGSFCGDSFRVGPAAVFIQVLVLLSQILYGNRKAIGYMLIPLYAVMMGNSRTYLVLGFLLFVISWYIFCNKRKYFWGTIIPLCAVVLLLISVSAMADKIAYTTDATGYGGIWFRLTSSRNVLWTENLTAWQAEGKIHKLLGSGLEFTIITTKHWAHNDFIELICSFGIVGLIQYIFAMRGLIRNNIKYTRMPFMIKCCAFMVWFFNAFFNMHYVYFCATLCYPFLLFALKWYFSKNPMELKWENNG